MSNTRDLPASLQEQLANLARRVRRRRWLLGTSRLLLLGMAAFAGLFVADLWLDFPQTVLRVALAAFVGVLGLAGLFGLLMPLLSRSVDAGALAAVIEEHYPQLGERLTSAAVQLVRTQGIGHGSPALIRSLLDEADAQTRPLDVTQVVPLRRSQQMAIVAGGALAAALLLALLWQPFGDFGERFLASWLPPRPPFALDVRPGDAHAARGRPVALSARVLPARANARLPQACFLVFSQEDGSSKRVPMQADRGGRFVYTWDRLQRDTTYHLEAGDLITPLYRLTAVDPVELTAAGPAIIVTPPAYVHPEVHPKKAILGPSEVLQFSTIKFDLPFTRPATAARVVVKAKAGSAWTLPLTLTPDRMAAHLELPVLDPATYAVALILEAEHGVTTAVELPGLTIWPDGPPAFMETPRNPGVIVSQEKTTPVVSADPVGGTFRSLALPYGHELARSVAPDEVLRLKVSVADREGLGQTDVEYRINDGPSLYEMVLEGGGLSQAGKEHWLRLKGKVKDGDLFFYRLRTRDNRQVSTGAFVDVQNRKVPAAALEPHTIFEPVPDKGQDRWFLLKVRQAADPLQKQEILAERDDIRKRLEAIKKNVEGEKAQVNKVRVESRHHPTLRADQVRELAALATQNREIEKDLYGLALQVSGTDVLRGLAAQVHGIAAEEMARSGQALGRAREAVADTDRREADFGQADEELARAIKRLTDLLKLNDELADNRLDHMKMEQLARQQEELAQRVAELQRQDPKADPKAQEEPARLRAEQEQLAQEFRKLSERSQVFQKALEAGQAEHARMLAKQAEALAKTQHDLNRMAQDALAKETQDRLAELAMRQEELAAKADKLARDASQSARAVAPLQTEPPREAAAALRKAEVEEATRKQDLTAQDLERLATDLIWSVVGPRSPREAARQLARLQAELQQQLEKLAQDVARLPPAELRKGLKDLARAEKAIEEGIKKLEVPGARKDLMAERQRAADDAGQAAERMIGDTFNAHQKMDQVRQTLERLAQALPEESQRPDLPKEGMEEQQRRKLAKQAGQLAKEQKELRAAVEKTMAELGKSKPDASHMAQQQGLHDQTADLMKELKQMGQKPGTSPHGQEQANMAAQSLEQAQSAMKQSLEQGQQSNPAAMQQSGREAAKMLDQAGKAASEAARELAAAMKGEPGSKTGQALQEGRMQMSQAKANLNQGKLPDARSAMQKAAQSLNQAAQQTSEQMAQHALNSWQERKGPMDSATGKHSLPDLRQFTSDLKPFTGKSWGELPGELRTRIVQDMRARYGDDHAAMIQQYFEAIADTNPPSPKR